MRIFVEFDGKQQYNIGFPTFKLPENNKKNCYDSPVKYYFDDFGIW